MMFNGVKIYNNRERNYANGGKVYKGKNMTMKQVKNDSVKAILMPNELVIPVFHKGKPLASKIERLLKNNNIYLPFMKRN